MEDREKQFGGFAPPVSNYFRMPNEWINICAEIKSLSELKVIQYVLRHTWGFQEYDGTAKKITTDEFMHGKKRKDGSRIDKGTGLSDRGVKDGVSLAIEHGYLICEVDETDKARIKKFYGLKMFSEVSDGKNAPIPDRKNAPIGRKNAPIEREDSSHRSEKDTIEKHLKKESKKDNAPEQKATVSIQDDSHSFTHSLSSETKPEIVFRSEIETKPEVVFSQEEEAIYALAEKLDLVYLKKDVNHKESCAKLIAKGVTTQEKLESLMQFCHQKPFLAGKDLNLKNLVNEVSGWLQLQRKATAAPSSSPVVSTIGKATAELLAKEEAAKQRILQKEAEQGGRRPSLQELVAARKKQKAEAQQNGSANATI